MKTAIVLSGGGLSCSWSVGVVLGLVEKFKFYQPDILVAGSGNAGTAAYFCSKQFKSIENIWGNLLSNKKFLNFFRFKKIMDIDFLIDEIFKKTDPLNIKKLQKTKINLQIATTHEKTGEIKFFSNFKKFDIFEVLRASKAIPFFYGKKIKIKKEKYCDGRLSSCVDLLLQRAIFLGAKKIIVINVSGIYSLRKILFNFYNLLKSKIKFQKFFTKNLKKIKNFQIPNNVDFIFLEPKNKKLNLKPFLNCSKNLQKNIASGRQVVLENKNLEKFMKNLIS